MVAIGFKLSIHVCMFCKDLDTGITSFLTGYYSSSYFVLDLHCMTVILFCPSDIVLVFECTNRQTATALQICHKNIIVYLYVEASNGLPVGG